MVASTFVPDAKLVRVGAFAKWLGVNSIMGEEMDKKEKMIILPCDCKCCMFVVEKTKWADGDTSYNITIQDSRYDHNYNTVWGRIKRAAKALFGKPVYFSDVHLEGEERYKKLVSDMIDLLNSNLDE